MNDCGELMSLQAAIRASQDLGLLPTVSDAGRRFQVLAVKSRRLS